MVALGPISLQALALLKLEEEPEGGTPMHRVKIPVRDRPAAILTVASYQQVLDKLRELAEKSRRALRGLHKPPSR